jgi:hypothetical protein
MSCLRQYLQTYIAKKQDNSSTKKEPILSPSKEVIHEKKEQELKSFDEEDSTSIFSTNLSPSF